MSAMTRSHSDILVEPLAVIRLGTFAQRCALAKNPLTPDRTRLVFKDDPDAFVRGEAVRGAKSDQTRLAFKDDTDAWVRATAVYGAKSDRTRLAFLGDHRARVREAAYQGMLSARVLTMAKD